jgi:cobalt/nickel transport system permease protein
MHLVDGPLSAHATGNAVLALTACASAGGIALGLRRMRDEDIPRVGIMSAAFFVVTMVAVPMGFGSTHLVLNGLMGVLLGWATFPAVFIALVLQHFMFGVGGITTLGFNTFIMAAPGVLCGLLFRRLAMNKRPSVVFSAGTLAGSVGLGGSVLLFAASLALVEKGLFYSGGPACLADLVLIPFEAFATGTLFLFLRRTSPELLAQGVGCEGRKMQGALQESSASQACEEQITLNESKSKSVRSERTPVRTTVPGRLLLLGLAFLISGFCGTAEAHQINIFAWHEGNAIQGEAYFRGGEPVIGSQVQLFNAENVVVGETQTDDEGLFQFDRPSPTARGLELTTPDGHQASFSLDEGIGTATEIDITQNSLDLEADPEDISDSVAVAAGELASLRHEILQLRREIRKNESSNPFGIIVGINLILTIAILYFLVRIAKERA